MRKKIVAGNWKMNTTLTTGVQLTAEISERVKTEVPNNEIGIIICPPYTHLATIQAVMNRERIMLGGQNCSNQPSGAYTGEITAEMLKSVGANVVIIGHSERRAYFKESSEMLLGKVNQALKNELMPVYCCGEQLEQRKNETHFDVVQQQLDEVVFKLQSTEFEKIIIAYEPVWAIGTGETATPAQAQEMHAHIRKLIAKKYGEQIADNTTLLYGGSCKPGNAKELFAQTDVDGGLIGGASLKADDFIKIINAF